MLLQPLFFLSLHYDDPYVSQEWDEVGVNVGCMKRKEKYVSNYKGEGFKSCRSEVVIEKKREDGIHGRRNVCESFMKVYFFPLDESQRLYQG